MSRDLLYSIMLRIAKPKFCEECNTQLDKSTCFGIYCPSCFNVKKFKDRRNQVENALRFARENGSELYTQYHVQSGYNCGKCNHLNSFCEPIDNTVKEIKAPFDGCLNGACSLIMQFMSKRKYYRDILGKPLP